MAHTQLENKETQIVERDDISYDDGIEDKGEGLKRIVKDTDVFLRFGVLFFGVIGVFMLTMSTSIAEVLPWILGIAALIFGLAYILKEKNASKRYNGGAAAVIVFTILLFRAEFSTMVCPILFGFLILFVAAIQLKKTYISLRLSDGKSYFFLTDTAVSVVLGVMTLFFPYDAVMSLIQFTGLMLVIECVSHYLMELLALLMPRTSSVSKNAKRAFTVIMIIAAAVTLAIFTGIRLGGGFGQGTGDGYGINGGSNQQTESGGESLANSLLITITENDIKCGDKTYKSADELTDLLNQAKEDKLTVILADSMAKKVTYDNVKSKISSVGLTVIETVK